jgi:hypothetical protein
VLANLWGLGAGAEKIERLIANRRADVAMNLCVAAAADPIVSNDAEELVQGRGGDVLAIGLTQVPERLEDRRGSGSHPLGEQLPGRALLRPATIEQTPQIFGHHRARPTRIPPLIKTLGRNIPSRAPVEGQ